MVTPAYYAVIPADVRYRRGIPDGARLLYGEITALCNAKGFCWATNKYFAELYDVHGDTIRRWVTALVKEGFITVEIDNTRGNERKIFLTQPLTANLREPHRKNTGTLAAKTPAPYKDNNQHSNSTKKKTISVADKSAPPKRGTRLPDDWQPSDELIEWATEKVPALFGRGRQVAVGIWLRETEKFKNYWESATGRNATKLNWDKAWKNWMMTADERLNKGNSKPTSMDAGKAYLSKLEKQE